jgi:putative Ca2+/H+ antiporter (TMEM165/GDT1 family)
LDPAGLAGAFLTICGTIFVAELTDKDALLLLALATKTKPLHVFAAGSIAFIATTTIIVVVGSALVRFIPIYWIKLAGGVIMLAYAGWEFVRGRGEEKNLEGTEEKLVTGWGKSEFTGFLVVVLSLAVLDLAGDATELLTIVFVAQFDNALLVFSAAALALVVASGFETILGNRLGKILTARRVRSFSIVVFLLIGTVIVLSTVLPTS